MVAKGKTKVFIPPIPTNYSGSSWCTWRKKSKRVFMDQMAHTEMVDYADNQEGTFSRLFLSQF